MADSTVYTIGYKPLMRPGEKMSAGYKAVLELAATAARIKVTHAGLSATGPTIKEYSSPSWTRNATDRGQPGHQGGGGDHPERALRPDAMPPDDLPRLPVILAKIERAGYRVSYKLNDAADFGVPQHRRRVIFFLSRNGEFSTFFHRFWSPIPLLPHSTLGADLIPVLASGLL